MRTANLMAFAVAATSLVAFDAFAQQMTAVDKMLQEMSKLSLEEREKKLVEGAMKEEEFNLIPLLDDQGQESADPITPVLNSGAVAKDLTAVIDRVSTVLTTDDVRHMNTAVEFERRDAEDVAAEFLRSKGLE